MRVISSSLVPVDVTTTTITLQVTSDSYSAISAECDGRSFQTKVGWFVITGLNPDTSYNIM